MLINPTDLENRMGEACHIGNGVWAQPMQHPFLKKTVFYSEKGKLFMDYGDLCIWGYCYEICSSYNMDDENYLEERYFSEEETINRIKALLGSREEKKANPILMQMQQEQQQEAEYKCRNCKDVYTEGTIVETNGAVGEEEIFLCDYCIVPSMHAVPVLRTKKTRRVG